MADLHEVEALGTALVSRYLPSDWTFGFDTAKKRAGACNFTRKRVTLSRYLAAKHPIEAMHQTLLHEIAHALAGHQAGHGPQWREIATRLGYVGGTTHELEVATEHATWIGTCPNGHEVHRFRRPTATARSCAKCSRSFDRRYLIEWRERVPSPGR